jgi:hypothetical protein
MRWIKSRTPPDLEEVLLYHPFKRVDNTDGFIIFVGWWDRQNRRYVCNWASMLTPLASDGNEHEFELKRSQVTHWMKLPSSPKVES